MSEVKRYRIKQANWAYMQQSDDGDYVRYHDYAALEAECERLADVLERQSVITSDYMARCQGLADERDTLKAELTQLRVVQERRAVDGWKLVPVEPTPDMAAQTAYNGTHYSDPFDFEDFKKDYAAMLAAAPSAPKADDPVKQMLLEALNGMLLHIREPESESEFQWPEHFKKQKAAFVAARAAIAAARKGE